MPDPIANLSAADHSAREGYVQRDELDALVTRRRTSLFEPDFLARADEIADRVRGRRVLVIGGGGSIGSITTHILTAYSPTALHVADHSENYLADLVRDLRGRPQGLSDRIDFRTLPIGYGTPIMERLLIDAEPYDVVLNFAALKHVRSEKDVYSLLQMIDTNVVSHIRFKRWLAAYGHGRTYFAVSTDKAANPTSLMGASKRLMEDLTFGTAADHAVSTNSARFANVAFSNGSLLQGFLSRIQQRQPLATPRDARRYFVSRAEAGELCTLAACVLPDQHIAFPRMNPESELQLLSDIAVRVLEFHGYEPVTMDDEERARREVEHLAGSRKWPLLLTPLDTSGEKPFEEFLGDGDHEVDVGLANVCAMRHNPSGAVESGLFDRLEQLVQSPTMSAAKAEIVSLVGEILANFQHAESARHLDQRL